MNLTCIRYVRTTVLRGNLVIRAQQCSLVRYVTRNPRICTKHSGVARRVLSSSPYHKQNIVNQNQLSTNKTSGVGHFLGSLSVLITTRLRRRNNSRQWDRVSATAEKQILAPRLDCGRLFFSSGKEREPCGNFSIMYVYGLSNFLDFCEKTQPDRASSTTVQY